MDSTKGNAERRSHLVLLKQHIDTTTTTGRLIRDREKGCQAPRLLHGANMGY